MRLSSIFTSLLVLFLTANISFAMTNHPKLPDKKWNPTVKGIELGSKYGEVISAIGKPRSRENNRKIVVLLYDGLTIELDSTKMKSMWVNSIEITSPKWEMHPNIQVGMHQKDILKILGSFLHEEDRDGRKLIWWWHGNPKFDSLFLVVFEKDQAVRIVFAQDKSI